MQNYSDIQTLMKSDMEKTDEVLIKRLNSNVGLINQMSHYIIASGGKRLRPLLLLLSARATNYKGKDHHAMAVVIELIHTATLLHDDVVDESTMRRGRETANAIFGNQASVLVGDFLYTRSFQMMVSLKRMRVMEILSEATNQIAEGEVLQLMNCNDASTTEARYFDVIYGKTARLFEAATQLSAVLTDQPSSVEVAMQEYGKHLGTAFQLADDILDYMADSEDMGKNAGDDLAEGKPTLPLLYAMWHAESEDDKALIKEAIEQSNGLPHLQRIQGIMEATGALDYTRECANKEVQMAIDSLQAIPDSAYKEALVSLAYISVERTS